MQSTEENMALSRLSQIWSESPALFTYHIVFFVAAHVVQW